MKLSGKARRLYTERKPEEPFMRCDREYFEIYPHAESYDRPSIAGENICGVVLAAGECTISVIQSIEGRFRIVSNASPELETRLNQANQKSIAYASGGMSMRVWRSGSGHELRQA